MADQYSSAQAEDLVRIIASAAKVQRRSQFFLWSQNVLQSFLPHQMALCGVYNRQVRELSFDAFYTVPLPQPLLDMFLNANSPLLQQITSDWVAQQGRCTTFDMATLGPRLGEDTASAIVDAGLGELLAHGVARPHRPSELESLFVLAAPRGRRWEQQHSEFLELMLPQIHSTYLRVQKVERELGGVSQPRAKVRKAEPSASITQRESEILRWVRDGKSNQQIGDELKISALTVKNHLQKILRKLGAANRAQAVAMAIRQNLIESGSSSAPS
jgi:transcriptional regulator EpsA